MALNTELATAAQNAAANAIAALCNSGKLRIYDGTQPAAGAAITTQNKLVEFTLGATAFGAAVNGVATANAIGSVLPTVAGTAAWFRVVESDGTTILFDGSVGTASSNLTLGTTTITMGVNQSVTSFTITSVASATGL